jgi:uncharacterized membrane protein YgdD (TMEM256/DUF423 family)
MDARIAVLIAAVALAAAVALGAFGAHLLKPRLSADALSVYQTAVQYHFWHALGLLGVGGLMTRWGDALGLQWTAWLLVAGLVLFSGSLYALALTGARWLGAVTPFGGAAFIVAWIVLAWTALMR